MLLLDTRPNATLDNITSNTCKAFQVPVALVSLVDSHRQWFKSRHNFEARQTGRVESFCAWTLLPRTPKVLLVQNASTDPRFRDNPLVVGHPRIKFYAGVPLIVDGHKLGTLCLIDYEAHEDFGAEKVRMLQAFGNLVTAEISQPAHHTYVIEGRRGGAGRTPVTCVK